jgi:hypothetical protein
MNTPPKTSKPQIYRGYTVTVATPSRAAFPMKDIRAALTHFVGMKIVVTSAPGLVKPRIKSLDIPSRARLGKVIRNGLEIPNYSKGSLWAAIQNALSGMKSHM